MFAGAQRGDGTNMSPRRWPAVPSTGSTFVAGDTSILQYIINSTPLQRCRPDCVAAVMGVESSEMLPFNIFVYTDTQQLAYFLFATLYSGAEETTTFKVIDPVFFWLNLMSISTFHD